MRPARATSSPLAQRCASCDAQARGEAPHRAYDRVSLLRVSFFAFLCCRLRWRPRAAPHADGRPFLQHPRRQMVNTRRCGARGAPSVPRAAPWAAQQPRGEARPPPCLFVALVRRDASDAAPAALRAAPPPSACVNCVPFHEAQGKRRERGSRGGRAANSRHQWLLSTKPTKRRTCYVRHAVPRRRAHGTTMRVHAWPIQTELRRQDRIRGRMSPCRGAEAAQVRHLRRTDWLAVGGFICADLYWRRSARPCATAEGGSEVHRGSLGSARARRGFAWGPNEWGRPPLILRPR